MEKSEKDKARKRISIVASYREVFNSPLGKRILYDLVQNHYLMSSTFSKDPMEMALREGERNCVLRILKMMNIKKEDLVKKLEEIENEQY